MTAYPFWDDVLMQQLDDSPSLDAAPSSSTERWFRPGLAVVAIVGLVWRLIYLFTSKVDNSPVVDQGDAFWYVTTARSLSRGMLFRNSFTHLPTAEHPPLTPLVLVPAARLSGGVMAQRLTMVLLGTAVIVVVGLAGRRLRGPVAGLAAAVAAASLPSLWINDVLVMSETLTALVTAGVIWAGIVLAQRATTRLAAGAGALCGLAALARAETALLLPLMIWVIIALSHDLAWSRRLALMGSATAGAILVMAPWIGLNLTRFEEPVAISTNDGVTLAGANCDAMYRGELKGGWVLIPCVSDIYAELDSEKGPAEALADPTEKPCLDAFQKQRPCLDPSQINKRMRSEGIGYIRDHLDEVPGVMLARNARVWGFYGRAQAVYAGVGEGRPPWASRLAFTTTWAMLPVSIGGLVLLRRRRIALAPFLAPLAIVVVTASLFTGLTPRIRVPWNVASCLLAGVVFATILDHFQGRTTAPPTTNGQHGSEHPGPVGEPTDAER